MGSSCLQRAAKQAPRDQQAVDLVGPLVDAVDAGVAPVAFGGEVLDEAGAPEDLHRLVDHVVQHLRAPDLGHRALDVVLLDPLELGGGVLGVDVGQVAVDAAGDAVHHRLGHVGQDGHLPDLVADQAEVGDRSPEGGAAAGVLHRLGDDQLGPAGDARPELEAADVEDVEGDLVPLADLAQQVLPGDGGIGQDERPGGRALDAQLLLLRAQADAGGPFLDDEGGEVLAVDLGEDDVEVGEARVGQPHLLAVEDPALTVGRQHRPRLGVQGVGGRGRLGQRIRGDPLPAGQLRQVLASSGPRCRNRRSATCRSRCGPCTWWRCWRRGTSARWRRWPRPCPGPAPPYASGISIPSRPSLAGLPQLAPGWSRSPARAPAAAGARRPSPSTGRRSRRSSGARR